MKTAKILHEARPHYVGLAKQLSKVLRELRIGFTIERVSLDSIYSANINNLIFLISDKEIKLDSKESVDSTFAIDPSMETLTKELIKGVINPPKPKPKTKSAPKKEVE